MGFLLSFAQAHSGNFQGQSDWLRARLCSKRRTSAKIWRSRTLASPVRSILLGSGLATQKSVLDLQRLHLLLFLLLLLLLLLLLCIFLILILVLILILIIIIIVIVIVIIIIIIILLDWLPWRPLCHGNPIPAGEPCRAVNLGGLISQPADSEWKTKDGRCFGI